MSPWRSLLLPSVAVAGALFAGAASRSLSPTVEVPGQTPAGDAIASAAEKHCGTCHVAPPPAFLPRARWRMQIQEMVTYSLLGTGLPAGAQSALWQSDIEPIVRYFEAHAPETLPAPASWPRDPGPLRFERHAFPGSDGAPAIANVRFFDLDGEGSLEIVACDMARGSVSVATPGGTSLREIARLRSPAHAEMVDLDKDGRRDLLIAELGEFLPGDHERGSVRWLRQSEPLRFEPVVLVSDLPRTADVQAADLDRDGDLDLVVAAFGWRSVGQIGVYENRTTDWRHPSFVLTFVDPRPGGIHVPLADLDGDDRMDFVALLSQHHEEVVSFRNTPGGFQGETLFRAPTPVWGSSGIQLVDMDRDGDLDLLMSNGDTLDDFTVKPFHGVRWFENRGRTPWLAHEVVAMPGVHRAQAADLDGDGDVDVACAAFLPDDPASARERSVGRDALVSLGWLEQVRPGAFDPHPLESGRLRHTTLDLADFDSDGDVDLVTGNFAGETFARTRTGLDTDAAVELWENAAKRRRAVRP